MSVYVVMCYIGDNYEGDVNSCAVYSTLERAKSKVLELVKEEENSDCHYWIEEFVVDTGYIGDYEYLGADKWA